MHLFLTGEIQVGKSTLINKTLQSFPGLRIGGFRSVTEADLPGTVGSVYLLRADRMESEVRDENNRIGIRYGKPKGVEHFPNVFENHGVEILSGAEDCDLIIMDEIGWMEGSSVIFRDRILALLDGETPVLGVVRQQCDSPLQIAVRNHPKVRLITVNTENRDDLPETLREWMVLHLNKIIE